MGGDVVRPFSNVDDPYASGQHRGVDVTATAGEPVLAPAGGVVSFAGPVPTSGVTVSILTADGYAVTLTHLGAVRVSKGITVAEGESVADAGSSGTPETPGTYVHLGVRVAADPHGYVDPLGLAAPAERPGDSRRSGRRDARARARAPSRSVGADIDAACRCRCSTGAHKRRCTSRTLRRDPVTVP